MTSGSSLAVISGPEVFFRYSVAPVLPPLATVTASFIDALSIALRKIGLASDAACSAAWLRLPVMSLVSPALSVSFISPLSFSAWPGSTILMAESAEKAPGCDSLSSAASDALPSMPLIELVCAWPVDATRVRAMVPRAIRWRVDMAISGSVGSGRLARHRRCDEPFGARRLDPDRRIHEDLS